MTAITIIATDVSPVKIHKQFSGPSSEAVSAGGWGRLNPTTGKIELGNATSVAELGQRNGLILTTAENAGDAVTVMEDGVADVGEALVNLDFDDALYVGDLDHYYADEAGTVEKIAGTVTPGWANTTPDKLLRVGG